MTFDESPSIAAKFRQSLGFPAFFSIVTMAAYFTFAKQTPQFGNEYRLFLSSSSIASIAVFPFILQSIYSRRSLLERIALVFWWPLKIYFLYLYVFIIWRFAIEETVYLNYSDHFNLHLIAVSVSNYWKQAGGMMIIPETDLHRISANYPTSAYLFGFLYYKFGHSVAVILPWLSYLHFISASMTQKLFEASGLNIKHAKLGFWLLLVSPAIWLFTFLLHRDIIIIFSLLLFSISVVSFLNKKYIYILPGSLLSIILIANLRSEYLYVFFVWFTITSLIFILFIERLSALQKFNIFIVFLFLAIVMFWMIFGEGSFIYFSKYDISEKAGNVFETYLRGGTAGRGFYSKVFQLGVYFFIPVILPFKFLIALTAPFPWRFGTFTYAVTQPFYSLESILRLMLFFVFVLNLKTMLAARKEKYFPILILGIGILLVGLLGPKNEVRYVAPALPLLTPLFCVSKKPFIRYVQAFFFAFIVIAGLHFLYVLLRGGY